jgi:hypothetical protein
MYAARLEARQAEAEHCAAHEKRLGTARLITFAVGAGGAILAYRGETSGAILLGVAVVGFAALALIHERVIRRHENARRSITFYERGLARIDHTFAGTGSNGDEYAIAHHAFASDLDVFGEGSLFEWLCIARTTGGEERLASWLLQPAPAEELLARREAILELREEIQLREDLALLAEDVRVRLHPDVLGEWGEAPAIGITRGHRIAAALLAAGAATALIAWTLGAGLLPLLIFITAELVFAASLRDRVKAILESVEAPLRELGVLAEMLERIEREPFSAESLRSLRARLDTSGEAPSRRIARLKRLLELVDARRNQFFAPIAALLLWGTQFAAAIEHWRGDAGAQLRGWIDVLSEFEALLSLAGNAWENPDAVFPELLESGPRIEGRGVAHPLLPAATRVSNDIELGPERPLFVVSGSNMSGKSTWLRTLGVNVVLGQAGGVVCAERLAFSPLRVGASIRIVDSLLEGASHFYAEIQRLRTILDLTEEQTGHVFFLLDEILHGTNSRDRAAGAEAVVTALVERGAIGLVTTHDLALAGIAERLGERAANVHFADQLENGEMSFDYKVQDGIVKRSNALALMKSVGLPID